jgi:energy-coupling factor transport system permease protein
MMTFHPWMIAISLIVSVAYGLMLDGLYSLKKNILIEIPIVLFSVVLQPLFLHNGVTPLFYINDNAVTLEMCVYGMIISAMLISVIHWVGCIGHFLPMDKLMYLFGRIIPTIGMILSMILRFVPLFKERFHQISDAQKGMGRTIKNTGFITGCRLYIRQLSILLSWSMEASIETAQSMESRGYGLKNRTSYHTYKISREDIWISIYLTILFIICVAGIVSGSLNVYYFPQINIPEVHGVSVGTMVAFVLLSIFPCVYDIRGAVQWKYWNSRI